MELGVLGGALSNRLVYKALCCAVVEIQLSTVLRMREHAYTTVWCQYSNRVPVPVSYKPQRSSKAFIHVAGFFLAQTFCGGNRSKAGLTDNLGSPKGVGVRWGFAQV